MQQQLEDAVRRAARADAAGDTFFDLATHELRSPLAAIIGYQELIAEGAYGPLPPDGAEAVARIGRSAHHLLHLIEGVVELGRLRIGAVRPDVQSIDLAPMLSGIADAFRVHARDRGLDAEIHLPQQPGTLRTDPDRLLRALDLVITSAVRHPGDDELRLDIDRETGALHVTITGAAIEIRDDDDPVVRLGVRLAIADALSGLLHGELRILDGDARHIRSLRFTARDLDPATSFDGPRGAR